MSCLVPAIRESRHWLICRNFEHVKECENPCGTTSWRCRKYQTMKCKARLVTAGNRVVRFRQPEHTHSGNKATALARKAVSEMKAKMGKINATSSSSQASVLGGRWTRQSGADGVAETKNAVEGSATWTTESANGRWWTAGVTSCSNWSSVRVHERDTEHVHGHGALWFGS